MAPDPPASDPGVPAPPSRFLPPPGRRVAVAGLAGLHFLVIGAWYVLRPLRDEFATVDPTRVPALWRDVFFAMLVASPLFAAVAGRVGRTALVAGTLALFAALTAAFLPVFHGHSDGWRAAGEHAFYVHCGVLSLFVVSVSWSFAVDLLDTATAARWFGPIAAAGTLGQATASAAMSSLRERVDPLYLLGAAAALLFAAAGLVLLLARRRDVGGPRVERVGGTFLGGLLAVFRSRYLLAIVGYMALTNTAGAVYYAQQSEILSKAFDDRAARGAFLADMNLWVGGITLLGQAFLNAALIARLGIGGTLLGLPVVVSIGLAAIGIAHANGASATVVLAVFAAAEVGRRSAAFALSRPTREVLFTLVDRSTKYRSKNLVDTAVYRGVDWAAVEGATWLRTGAGLSLAGAAFATMPLCAGWCVLAWMLGRLAARRAPALGGGGVRVPSAG